jgi:hypothetical protein
MATYSMDGRTFNTAQELYDYQNSQGQTSATEEDWARFDPEFAAQIGINEEQWNQLVAQINAARQGNTGPIQVGPGGSHGANFFISPESTPQELFEGLRGLAYQTVNPDAYPNPVNTQREFIKKLGLTAGMLMGGAAAGGAFAGGGAPGIASGATDGLTGVSTGGAQYLPGGQFPINSVVAGSAEGLAQMPAWAGAGLPAGEGMLTDFLGIGGGGGEVLSEVPLLPEGVGYMTPPGATDALTGVSVPSAGKYINEALPYTAGPAASAFGTGPITSAAAGLAANAAAGAAQNAGGGGAGQVPNAGGGGGTGNGIDWGQWLPQILSGVTGLYGYQQAQDNIAAAQQAQNDALMKGLDYARESRDMVFAQQEPFRQSSLGALRAMHSLTGLPVPDQLANPPQVMGAQQQAAGTVQAGGPGGLVGMAPREDLIGLARGGPTRGSSPYVVSEYSHPERVFTDGRMEVYRRPAMIAASRTGYVSPQRGPLRGRAVGGSLEPYGETSVQTLGGGSGYPQNGQVPMNPGGQPGGYNFMTDPGYQFRIDEGMRALENSAAARGGLLSGGFAKQALRYATDYSAQEYTNVYNRIANIAGLNQVSGPLQANAASQYGATAPNIAAAQGANAASGYTAQNNASASMLNQIATAFGDIDWDSIFGNKK